MCDIILHFNIWIKIIVSKIVFEAMDKLLLKTPAIVGRFSINYAGSLTLQQFANPPQLLSSARITLVNRLSLQQLQGGRQTNQTYA